MDIGADKTIDLDEATMGEGETPEFNMLEYIFPAEFEAPACVHEASVAERTKLLDTGE